MSFYSARNFAAILRRAKFGKAQIARTCSAEFSAEAKREAMFEETNWNMRSRARFEISASTLQEEIVKFGYFSR